MDWSTTVAFGSLALGGVTIVLILVRGWANANDESVAAKRAEVEELAAKREAERERDANAERASKAEGELAIANADNAKLHSAIATLVASNQDAVKEKINAATGDTLVDLARTVLGVPNLRVPDAGRAGDAAAADRPAPTAAVRVP